MKKRNYDSKELHPDVSSEGRKKLIEKLSKYGDGEIHTLLIRPKAQDLRILFCSYANPCGIKEEDYSLYNRLHAIKRKDGKYDVFVDELTIKGVKTRDDARDIMKCFVDEKGEIVDFGQLVEKASEK